MENKSIDRFIGETETRLSSLEQRIEKQDGLLQDIHSLALTMRDITHVLESTVQKTNALEDRICGIERAPLENWKYMRRSFWGTVASVVAAAVVGYLAFAILHSPGL